MVSLELEPVKPIGSVHSFSDPNCYVHAIGVGETAKDLQPFDPNDFARSLMGISGER
jgi:signal recognition particle GTPase